MSMGHFSTRIILIAGLAWLASGCAPTSLGPTDSSAGVDLDGGSPYQSWLLVDTKKDRLVVMRGDQQLKVFPNLAFGSSGVGVKYGRGDNKTPLGVFRVGWINEHSRFKTFIGLDYPNVDYAQRALRDHRIDALTYERIRAAWLNGYTPPQDTLLGGQIGIHGVGRGDPEIHRAGINWTSGCVALDNQQIAALRPWVKIGMRVEIR